MSRIGKKIIPLPSGATVEIQPSQVTVKGPKGNLQVTLPPGIRVMRQDGHLLTQRDGNADSAPMPFTASPRGLRNISILWASDIALKLKATNWSSAWDILTPSSFPFLKASR